MLTSDFSYLIEGDTIAWKDAKIEVCLKRSKKDLDQFDKSMEPITGKKRKVSSSQKNDA